MNWRFVCLLAAAYLGLSLSAAQELQQKLTTTARKPRPEMQRLFNTFLGTWRVTEKIERGETLPSGGAGEGTEVYRAGPGGASIIEEIHLKETSGEFSGMGVAWWDEKGQGYRALWCNSENPNGCILMAHLAKWEGEQFVLRDEFENNGRSSALRKSFPKSLRLPLRKLFIREK
jgi:hypothetical protein